MAFAFRDHDYQLGRRNCQWFLKQHFGLPFDNAVMGDYYSHISPAKRIQFAASGEVVVGVHLADHLADGAIQLANDPAIQLTALSDGPIGLCLGQILDWIND